MGLRLFKLYDTIKKINENYYLLCTRIWEACNAASYVFMR